jgi:hypothetical protein
MNIFKFNDEGNYINNIKSKVISDKYPKIKENDFKQLASYHISRDL